MSELRTMDSRTLLTPEGDLFPSPQPGDAVRFCLDPGSYGMVVRIVSDEQVEVLWSKLVSPPFFGHRNKNKDMFPAQPTPTGALPFYLDHMLGKPEEEEK